ncbi:MAG TPA: hypothetical protein VH396_01950 [Chitinophagaceae bacterium]|jgi:hypothetical protein
MSVNEIREEIIRSVKKMPENELKFFHEIFQIFIEKEDESGMPAWKELPKQLKKRINKSLQQMERGEGRDAFEIIAELKNKYGVK